MKFKSFVALLTLIVLLLGTRAAFAAAVAEAEKAQVTNSAEATGPTSALASKVFAAKKHNYPGGNDEHDLTVQAVLPVPNRSADVVVQTTQTPNEEEAQPADHD